MLRSRITSCFQRFLLKDARSVQHMQCIVLRSKSPYSVPAKLFSASSQVWAEPVIVSATQAVQEAAIPSTVPTTPASSPLSLTDIGSSTIDPSFVDIGLAGGWYPYQIVEGWLESFYIATGCPWWLTIIAGTIALRAVTLPLFIFSRKTMGNFSMHMPESSRLRSKLMDAYSGTDMMAVSAARTNYRAYLKKHKIGNFRLLASNTVQPFIFISCLMALRDISSLPLPSLQATEFLWITNLTEPDPYRLLPFIAGSTIGLNIFTAVKLNATAVQSESLKKYVKYIAILPPVLMPLIFGGWPSSVAIYVVTNSIMTLAVTAVLSQPSIQKKLDLPVPSPTAKSSGSHMKDMLKESLASSQRKALQRMERSEIKRMLKNERKARKKELKEKPPVLFDIGSEAVLKSDQVPDFKKDWRPPRVNIYQLQPKTE